MFDDKARRNAIRMVVCMAFLHPVAALADKELRGMSVMHMIAGDVGI